MSTGQLSEALAAQARPIPPSGITKIEKHVRRVDADDLVALALALNVGPVALLMPAESDSRTTVHLTDEVAAKADDAWKWASGEATLPELWEPRDPQRQEDYERLSVPAVQRHLRQAPAGRTVDALREDVYRLLELANVASDTVGIDDEFARRLELARETVARLTNEFNRIEARHAELEKAHKERRVAREREGNG
ncbi:hypothetical protein ACWDD9_11725 [Kitasatospora sp. NPDC001119]